MYSVSTLQMTSWCLQNINHFCVYTLDSLDAVLFLASLRIISDGVGLLSTIIADSSFEIVALIYGVISMVNQ